MLIKDRLTCAGNSKADKQNVARYEEAHTYETISDCTTGDHMNIDDTHSHDRNNKPDSTLCNVINPQFSEIIKSDKHGQKQPHLQQNICDYV